MCAFDRFLRFWLIFAVVFKIRAHVLHVSLLFCHVSLCVFCFFCKFLVDFKTCSLFRSDLSLFFRVHVFFRHILFFWQALSFFPFFSVFSLPFLLYCFPGFLAFSRFFLDMRSFFPFF